MLTLLFNFSSLLILNKIVYCTFIKRHFTYYTHQPGLWEKSFVRLLKTQTKTKKKIIPIIVPQT